MASEYLYDEEELKGKDIEELKLMLKEHGYEEDGFDFNDKGFCIQVLGHIPNF